MHRLFTYQSVQRGLQTLALLQCSVHRGVTCYGVNLLISTVHSHHFLKVSHVFFLLIGHVIDVRHVCIKPCLEAEITENQRQNDDNSHKYGLILQ